ncbi:MULTISPECIES: (deoxy)nucleoside triphosphate pyrophosphohydrolase [Novosphingobium]|uniref:8-oxo-dGTP diphosphatase n=1 Tax=Novosphingobium mathurense TaxID=428990 RepID=A0A1U6H3D4_9SPHN|nr:MULTISPECIES: (deoxy)nucleoside triphosphate pyrophosphohydrolase [Novosphingobium]CDO34235.1 NUDIX hydrolase [Novosphingobium sp. KN65.2]SLJ90257.1 8-oxo-dGTP diphosphatase [Novosphingobium mathurense]
MLVVAVALRAADDRILMQQRNFSAVHGGLWEFPGGKVEDGESPEMAAVRELEEELAVRIEPDALVPVGFASGSTAGGKGPSRPLVILLYACSRWQGEPHPHEAEAIAWHACGAIHGLSMPPLDYPLAEALCSFLARKTI